MIAGACGYSRRLTTISLALHCTPCLSVQTRHTSIIGAKQGSGLSESGAVPSAEEAEELKAKAGGIRTWIVLEAAAQTVLLI